jgi:hypothetical protein
MTFARAAFAFVLIMLVATLISSHYVFGSIFGGQGQTAKIDAARATQPASVQPSATAARAPTSQPTVRPTATPRATPTATPQLTPTLGTITLARYWVGTLQVRRGQTISVGYVIDNGTGHTARVLLGASVKATRALSWAGAAVSDPYHDAVAVVPPGISTHVRYFTLPVGIRPGFYDAAWGLRDAATGRRDALVTAAAVLRVIG